MNNTKVYPPMSVVFQNLHFDRNWDITDGSSLWSLFILNNISETLVRVGNNSDVVSALSSGWIFSTDKRVLRFSISDKYTFHDGKPIRPEDVLESLKRSFRSDGMKHSEIRKSLLGNLDDSVQLKGNVIEIRLKGPLNALAYKFSISEMGIAPQDYAKKTPKDGLHNLSGPYKVVDFTSKKLHLEKHSGHPLLHPNSPDRVNLIEVPNKDAVDYYHNHDNVVLIGSGYANALKYIDLTGKKYISSFVFTEFFIPNIESENLNTKQKRKSVFSTIKRAFDKISIDERVAEKTNQIFTKNNLSRLKEEKLSDIYKGDTGSVPKKISVLLFGFMHDTPIIPLLRKELESMGVNLEVLNPKDK
ncbi:MAG: ABC transporter substrate-binding protein, partial [Halobacteriovoraceae bacterium]|nr:ABC transporter substrate-binding protein [Halobacteriovoraceae bacterium]